jgi:hypothetical protein
LSFFISQNCYLCNITKVWFFSNVVSKKREKKEIINNHPLETNTFWFEISNIKRIESCSVNYTLLRLQTIYLKFISMNENRWYHNLCNGIHIKQSWISLSPVRRTNDSPETQIHVYTNITQDSIETYHTTLCLERGCIGIINGCNDHNIRGKLPIDMRVESPVTLTYLSVDCFDQKVSNKLFCIYQISCEI